jgi:hypothetical protein
LLIIKSLKDGLINTMIGDKNFEIGDLVLKWDRVNEPKGKHTKFQNLWLGPFQIAEKIGAETYRLKSLEGDLYPLPAKEFRG